GKRLRPAACRCTRAATGEATRTRGATRRCAARSPGARRLPGRTRAAAARDVRTDCRAVEDATVDVVIGLHLELQFEVGRLGAAPDDEGRAHASIGPGLSRDGAVLDAPHVGIAVPVLERSAIEDGCPARMVVGLYRVGRQ